jgi:hypothetical protein
LVAGRIDFDLKSPLLHRHGEPKPELRFLMCPSEPVVALRRSPDVIYLPKERREIFECG